jgi:predicted metal-dependent peptidase
VAKWLAGFTEEELSSLEEIFSWDDHSRWRGSLDEFMEAAKVSPEPLCPEQLKEAIHTVHRWRTAFEQLEQRSEEHKRQAGGSAGSQAQQVILEQEQGYDYRQFLRRFMTSREELMLDVDSFDLIPYDYSRRMYERLVLMEPLEYKEVHKLEELVIAIDTSGSCSGAIVRNFLEETGAIFRERDAFFQKVNIHLLQCDCLIQEHVCITCEANWEEYLNHLEVKGHGDTDFTPVFDLVDRMLEEGAFRNLKGLLYFTDGDGIYPTKQPIYETAFVFLNQELQKGKVPDWAISLTIDKELETGR